MFLNDWLDFGAFKKLIQIIGHWLLKYLKTMECTLILFFLIFFVGGSGCLWVAVRFFFSGIK